MLKSKLKELGEAYQDYANDDDPDSRNYYQSCINDITADIIDYVEREIENAVAEERAKHD